MTTENTSTPNTVQLEFPIQSNGATLSSIKLRRPKVRDRLTVQKLGGTDAEQEVRLIANLSGLSPADIEELDAADYLAISEILSDFFKRNPANSAKP